MFSGQTLKDGRLREDLIDVAIAEERSKDKAKPFRDAIGLSIA